MRIDYDRVREVLEANPCVDDCTAYYRQYDVEQRRLGQLVPDFSHVLQKALAPSMHVLDVGCGRGDTLLDHASLFRWGTGIDESEDVMLAAANRAKELRNVRNVDFRAAKAIDLPLEDESIDLVFSERGPVGHIDGTLKEPLRVLRPGGLIFIETSGELDGWEMRQAFNPEYRKPVTMLAALETERGRFQRHGVRIQTLASRIQTIQFPDFYEWLKFQCRTWYYPPREMLCCECKDEYERLMAIAADSVGRINITRHLIWVGGSKG